ncbi:MAG: cell surface protein [Hellea sp.]|nr:cell surface protein [Hellea sp.]
MEGEVAKLSALQYLDKALGGLRELGLLKGESDPVPIVTLLDQISDLDEANVTAIARTLNQASYFNEVVREQVSGIKVAARYEGITTAFNSIRDDTKALVDQYADGKIGTMEKVSNFWMKLRRGTIASRFDKIKDLYTDVTEDTSTQIEREQLILEAYMDFRGAMKNAEVLSFDVLEKAHAELEQAKEVVGVAVKTVEAYTGDDKTKRAELELDRDEKLRALQTSDKRYQVAKDLSDNLTIGYNTSEVVMARLVQTKNAKERVYAQSISFFSTNEVVLTALSATLTGMHGLHESTQTLEAMKKGMNESLEVLAEVGDKVQEAAIRSGYGPTVSAAAVKKLLDAVVSYQERSHEIIAEMRHLASENSKEIRVIVEDGKRRLAKLAESGASTTLLIDQT